MSVDDLLIIVLILGGINVITLALKFNDIDRRLDSLEGKKGGK